MSAAAVNPSVEGHELVELESHHVLKSYGRYPLVVEKGKGVYLYDDQGEKYLDFISGIGVTALGHAHPRLTKIIREQAGKLIHCSNLYYHPYQGELAKRLARMSGLERAFFCNSGAEAVEGALKIAKGYGQKLSKDKFEIVALEGSFAGRTLGALSVTGQDKYREPFAPLIPGVKFIPPNDVAALEAAVNKNTCAVFFEPIMGEGGIVQITREFALAAQTAARANDALLIFDEIQCGLGRSGAYFAYELWNRPEQGGKPGEIHPDIVTAAKPLGGGLPLGAILVNEKAVDVITPGMHGSTFGGGPLACRTALEFLDVMEELLPLVREHGHYFHRRLEELALKYDFVVGPRGSGLMVGLELAKEGNWVVPAAQAKGLLMNCTAGNILRFLPPYIIERRHIDRVYDILNEIFEEGPQAA